MKIDPFIQITQNQMTESRREELRKEQAATDFEEIFAKYLVNELTKDSFNMSDNESGMGQTNSLYREFITDALSSELAAQRRLGMADLITRYWDQIPNSSKSKL